MKRPTKRAWRKWIKRNVYSWYVYCGKDYSYNNGRIEFNGDGGITRTYWYGFKFAPLCNQELRAISNAGFVQGFILARGIMHKINSQTDSVYNKYHMHFQHIRKIQGDSQ